MLPAGLPVASSPRTMSCRSTPAACGHWRR